MTPDAVERKLAAILSADVVGYSRLMAADEAGTIRTLTAYRDQVATLVREHRGRVVDSPGDNILAEFPTALDAVQAAVEIHRVIQARNADQPAERRMQFRIGVHLGDISVEGDRIYGDGVNIAARLEGLAQPGGVCISDVVYNQVEKKLTVDLEDLGEQTLKNIARPVHVYGMKLVLPGRGREAPEKALPGMEALTVPGFGGRPAIAVLPFENLSGDPEQEYFSDGIAEDLLTRLSVYRDFPVIARNSSFVYKGQSVDVKRVSRELGARYVVEGSVRKAADRVRVSAQLIDASSGAHVWAQRYDRELRDIFTIQDEITEAIAGSIMPELHRSEWKRTLKQEPQDMDAWDSYMRGMWHLRQFTKEDQAKARSLFQRATELDPNMAWAFAALAMAHEVDVENQWSESPVLSLSEAERAVQRAIALSDDDPFVQLASGTLRRLTGHLDESVDAIERAVRLDPSYAAGWYHLGMSLALTARPEKAIESLKRAMRLSPRDPWTHLFLWGMSVAHGAAGRYEDAVSWGQQSLQRNANYPLTYLALAGSYAALGRLDQAKAAIQDLLRISPGFSLTGIKRVLSGADPLFAERIIDGLRKAELPE